MILRYLVLVVYFFDPVIWLAFYASGRDCELACDEEVSDQICEEEHKEYGACLLSIVERRQRMNNRIVLSTNMSTGKKFMKERILNIMDRKKKSHLAMMLTVILMVVITGCAYEKNNAGTVETETRNLTEEELKQIGEWASDIENYGFFLSSYQDPRYADYDEVFYVGAGMDVSYEYSSEEVAEEYLRLTGDEEVMTDITVLKRSDIDQFLHRKVGIGVEDIGLTWMYSSTYDLYYFQHGDTNAITYQCTEGSVTVDENGEKLYTVTLKPLADYEGMGSCTATLKGAGSEYEILSCMYENCGHVEDVTVKEVESGKYSPEDIRSAIDTVIGGFYDWNGCTLKEIYYAGDDIVAMESREDYASRYQADEVIELFSSFDVGEVDEPSAWNENSTYDGWNWILVRNKGGRWRIVDFGY